VVDVETIIKDIHISESAQNITVPLFYKRDFLSHHRIGNFFSDCLSFFGLAIVLLDKGLATPEISEHFLFKTSFVLEIGHWSNKIIGITGYFSQHNKIYTHDCKKRKTENEKTKTGIQAINSVFIKGNSNGMMIFSDSDVSGSKPHRGNWESYAWNSHATWTSHHSVTCNALQSDFLFSFCILFICCYAFPIFFSLLAP